MAYYRNPSARRKDRNDLETMHPYRPLNPFAPSVALNIWSRHFIERIRSFDEINPLRFPLGGPADHSRRPLVNPRWVPPPPGTYFEFPGGHNPYTTQQPPGPNYDYIMVPKLRHYLWTLFTEVLPRQIYLFGLLRLPALYYDRTSRVFQSAGLTLEEIKDMALKAMAEDHQAFQAKMLHAGYYYSPQDANLSPVYHRLKTNWESFIDKLVMEWQTLNIISALLVPGVLTMFQIEGAADDPITRYIAFWSLLCALISVLIGCLFLVRFSNMRKPHKAAEWALETQKHQNIFWNVWVMMAMPVLWLAWSIFAFIICIMLFLWRFSTNQPMDFTFATRPHMELGFRIFICVVLGIGILYIILTAATLMRYGNKMDEAWMRRIEVFITAFDPQPPFHQLSTNMGNPITAIPTQHLPVHEPPSMRPYSPASTTPPRPRSPQVIQVAPPFSSVHEPYSVLPARRPSYSPPRPHIVRPASTPESYGRPRSRSPSPPRRFMRETYRPERSPVRPPRIPSLSPPRPGYMQEAPRPERHPARPTRIPSLSPPRPVFVQEAPRLEYPPPRPEYMQEAPRPGSYPAIPVRPPSLPSPLPELVQEAPLSPLTSEHRPVLPARPPSQSRPQPQFVQEISQSPSIHERHQLSSMRPRSPSSSQPQFVQETTQLPHAPQFSSVPVQPGSRSPSGPQLVLSESPEPLTRPQRHRSSTSYTHDQPPSPHFRQHHRHQAPSDGPPPTHSRRVPPLDTSLSSSHRPYTLPHTQRSPTSLLGEEGRAMGSADDVGGE